MAEKKTLYGAPSELFSYDWGVSFCDSWRGEDSGNLEEYAALGTVTFELCEGGSPISVLSLRWNDAGQPEIAQRRDDCPKFVGHREGWFRFIVDDISPFMAVVSGLIRYEGPMAFAIQNGHRFEKIRNVARATRTRG